MQNSQIMGIVNVTPDSFSDGGAHVLPNHKVATDRAVAFGLKLVAEGADILDIGGESTRPGALSVCEAEEYERTIPVVTALVREAGVPISIDTRKPSIARAAYQVGAEIWNDVSALTFTPEAVTVAAELQMRVVLMHAQGNPETMQNQPRYGDPVKEVKAWLAARIAVCEEAGLGKDKLIVDPGIGFGKMLDHNLALISGLNAFVALGCPVLLGASRKRFIGEVDRRGLAADRCGGSVAALLAGAARGVRLFRVHDVAETRQALAVFWAIEEAAGQ